MSGEERYHEGFRWAVSRRILRGEKVENVSKCLGVSTHSIRAWCREHGVRPRYRRVITPEVAVALKRIWDEGMMAKQMAVETGVEVNTILSYVSSHRDVFGYRYDMGREAL